MIRSETAALSVTHHLAGPYGVVLMYRGSWCPYCNAQLSAFARAKEKLDELGIRVVALSIDSKADAAALVEKHRLNFPVGYGVDADKIAASTGAYVNDSPRYLQSTGFVLDPDGKVITAVYSSGAIGRLVAEDVIGFVRLCEVQGLNTERAWRLDMSTNEVAVVVGAGPGLGNALVARFAEAGMHVAAVSRRGGAGERASRSGSRLLLRCDCQGAGQKRF